MSFSTMCRCVCTSGRRSVIANTTKNTSSGNRLLSTYRPLTATNNRRWFASSPASSDVSTAPTTPGFDITQILASESKEGRPVYLDMQATTPMDPRVVDAMLPFMTEMYGNVHSKSHTYGRQLWDPVENARKDVADLIGADPLEVVFTSGATESNNIAIKGVSRFYSEKKKHIITTQTEHKCVLDSCRQMEQEGFDVTYLPVRPNGLVDIESFANALRPDTVLASVMTVNNEIGVIQPIKELAALTKKNKSFFHTDAAQAVGKIPFDVNDLNVDLVSLSGHKLYGPKGIGAIYVRRRPRVRIKAVQSGGGQERGIRSGTIPTPLVVGLGAACRIAREELANDTAHIERLSSRLYDTITKDIPDIVLNGDAKHRYAGCTNISFAYVEGESLLMALKDVALSSGSACTSASLEPSYVLRALGVKDEMAHTSIRFGIGRFTTEQEVDLAVGLLKRHVERLREMSPLWEMVQEGIDIDSIQWSQEH
eukprot:TRINITY_DN1756_c0_g1_i1.p1 TRINITY_DN1756_c0_g1~~TRINITY_DN1756_c0_g1_i1.p1  ORF type:complete len:482 (+),score=121.25 TRINITY_DN1756_c0_g1_i1:159-1604(+)